MDDDTMTLLEFAEATGMTVRALQQIAAKTKLSEKKIGTERYRRGRSWNLYRTEDICEAFISNRKACAERLHEKYRQNMRDHISSANRKADSIRRNYYRYVKKYADQMNAAKKLMEGMRGRREEGIGSREEENEGTREEGLGNRE